MTAQSMTIITVVINKFNITERGGELFGDDLVVFRVERLDVEVMPLLEMNLGEVWSRAILSLLIRRVILTR